MYLVYGNLNIHIYASLPCTFTYTCNDIDIHILCMCYIYICGASIGKVTTSTMGIMTNMIFSVGQPIGGEDIKPRSLDDVPNHSGLQS